MPGYGQPVVVAFIANIRSGSFNHHYIYAGRPYTNWECTSSKPIISLVSSDTFKWWWQVRWCRGGGRHGILCICSCACLQYTRARKCCEWICLRSAETYLPNAFAHPFYASINVHIYFCWLDYKHKNERKKTRLVPCGHVSFSNASFTFFSL